MTFYCCYCRKEMELQRDASRLNCELKQRIYCYYCNGFHFNSPHPPLAVVAKVTAAYDGQNIKNMQVFIYQEIPKRDVLVNFRKWQHSKNHRVRPPAEDGPKEKDRHNPYTARFKCPLCSQKPEKNDAASTYSGVPPDERIIAYECKNHDVDIKGVVVCRPVSYQVTKIFINEKNFKALPVPYELYKVDLIEWERRVVSNYAPEIIRRRRE